MTSERDSERRSERPWSVPVALSDVPETGRHFDLVADAQTRDAIARLADLTALPRLTAGFDVTLRGRHGLHVVGHVSATVGQTCVVTLEPIENEVDEAIDLVFTPGAASPSPASSGEEIEISAEDESEPLADDTVDLGALATEFLLLGIDPYPRKPGAVFETPAPDDDAAHPFAALAALKKGTRQDGD
jgi:uncharacterized metal-binding protein YceD (DUF177 family)